MACAVFSIAPSRSRLRTITLMVCGVRKVRLREVRAGKRTGVGHDHGPGPANCGVVRSRSGQGPRPSPRAGPRWPGAGGSRDGPLSLPRLGLAGPRDSGRRLPDVSYQIISEFSYVDRNSRPYHGQSRDGSTTLPLSSAATSRRRTRTTCRARWRLSIPTAGSRTSPPRRCTAGATPAPQRTTASGGAPSTSRSAAVPASAPMSRPTSSMSPRRPGMAGTSARSSASRRADAPSCNRSWSS